MSVWAFTEQKFGDDSVSLMPCDMEFLVVQCKRSILFLLSFLLKPCTNGPKWEIWTSDYNVTVRFLLCFARKPDANTDHIVRFCSGLAGTLSIVVYLLRLCRSILEKGLVEAIVLTNRVETDLNHPFLWSAMVLLEGKYGTSLFGNRARKFCCKFL